MKFEDNSVLYYVNPFVFNIEKVRVDNAFIGQDGFIYYWDNTGAIVEEKQLFKTVEGAKNQALRELEKFYKLKKHEINNCSPRISKGYYNEND